MRVRRSYLTVLKQDKDDTFDRRILNLEARLNEMAGELAALQAKANEVSTKINAAIDKQQEAILLLGTLTAMINDLQTGGIDPTKLTEVTTVLTNAEGALIASSDALSSAIIANTPPPPAP